MANLVGHADFVLGRLYPMPTVELDDIELVEAARGASSTREIFERAVRFHEGMAQKFEQARKSVRSCK